MRRGAPLVVVGLARAPEPPRLDGVGLGGGELDRPRRHGELRGSQGPGPAGGTDGDVRLRHARPAAKTVTVTLGRRHPCHELRGVPVDTTATGTYTLQTTRDDHVVDQRRARHRHLLLRGGGQHRHQLGQRQVGGDGEAHHQQFDLLLSPRLVTTGTPLARRMVVRAGTGRIVEVRVGRPGPLGPVPVGGRQMEHRRHVGQQRVGVAGAALGAEVHVVELAHA